jgi:peptidyl-prolyl cis-trans isomerase A (cyclophilin A)
MHKLKVMTILLCLVAVPLWSQTKSTAPAAKRPSKPPVAKSDADISARIETTAGKLNCKLFPDKAPIGVQNFIDLSEGKKDWTSPTSHQKKHGVPLYDGTIFHRVIPNFMIQGGDPAGNGTGDPGYAFKNETSPDLKFDRPGRLAYANAGPDTNGSQFFITEVPYPSLNGNYTIFGQCDEATVALVKDIARMGKDANDHPFRPVKIVHITILRGGANPPKSPESRKFTKKPAVAPKTVTPPQTAPQ